MYFPASQSLSEVVRHEVSVGPSSWGTAIEVPNALCHSLTWSLCNNNQTLWNLMTKSNGAGSRCQVWLVGAKCWRWRAGCYPVRDENASEEKSCILKISRETVKAGNKVLVSNPTRDMKMFSFCACCPVQVEALRQANPPSKQSYKMSKEVRKIWQNMSLKKAKFQSGILNPCRSSCMEDRMRDGRMIIKWVGSRIIGNIQPYCWERRKNQSNPISTNGLLALDSKQEHANHMLGYRVIRS
jgi:hypothetical protein